MDSFDRSSPIIVEPPDTLSTIGVSIVGFTHVLRIPLVSIIESTYFASGPIVLDGDSSFSVGPKK
jgi:hypothetical protein